MPWYNGRWYDNDRDITDELARRGWSPEWSRAYWSNTPLGDPDYRELLPTPGVAGSALDRGEGPYPGESPPRRRESLASPADYETQYGDQPVEQPRVVTYQPTPAEGDQGPAPMPSPEQRQPPYRPSTLVRRADYAPSGMTAPDGRPIEFATHANEARIDVFQPGNSGIYAQQHGPRGSFSGYERLHDPVPARWVPNYVPHHPDSPYYGGISTTGQPMGSQAEMAALQRMIQQTQLSPTEQRHLAQLQQAGTQVQQAMQTGQISPQDGEMLGRAITTNAQPYQIRQEELPQLLQHFQQLAQMRQVAQQTAIIQQNDRLWATHATNGDGVGRIPLEGGGIASVLRQPNGNFYQPQADNAGGGAGAVRQPTQQQFQTMYDNARTTLTTPSNPNPQHAQIIAYLREQQQAYQEFIGGGRRETAQRDQPVQPAAVPAAGGNFWQGLTQTMQAAGAQAQGQQVQGQQLGPRTTAADLPGIAANVGREFLPGLPGQAAPQAGTQAQGQQQPPVANADAIISQAARITGYTAPSGQTYRMTQAHGGIVVEVRPPNGRWQEVMRTTTPAAAHRYVLDHVVGVDTGQGPAQPVTIQQMLQNLQPPTNVLGPPGGRPTPALR